VKRSIRGEPRGRAGARRSTASSSPRVVRVIARLNVGGPAIHVLNLSEGLEGRYSTVLVAGAVDETEADMSSEAEARGVRLRLMPELGRRISPFQDVAALVKLYRLFRRLRPQIVHTHTAKAGTLGRLAAVGARVPVRVHTFHGHVMRGYFSPWISRAVVAVERMLARTSTCIVTVSDGQARELVEHFGICPAGKMRVVPLGFDFARFAPERISAVRGQLRAELGVGSAPVVTIVGRLVPIKNQALFLEAAARVVSQREDCTFVVVGGGPLEGALRARADALGLEGRVRFLGWRSDLDRIFADSDVVALTSDNEGTPVALIEALACGCSVVSTDVGGVSDVLEEGRLGRLVPPGHAQELADAIEHLLGDPAGRQELGRAGIRSVHARYGVERLVDEIAGIYDELLARAGLGVSPSHFTARATSCTI
jgi:glycosyltransferase involved in cell wall biosynthesis